MPLRTVSVLAATACAAFASVEGNAVVLQGQTFHFEWLRERCQTADHCVDEETLQQKRNPHEFERPVVTSATVDEDALVVAFGDGINATYSVSALLEEKRRGSSEYDPFMHQVKEFGVPELMLWNSNLTAPPLEYFDEVQNDEPTKRRVLANLLTVGVTIVRGVPLAEGECSKMANHLSTLRPTEWGTQFNVRAIPDDAQPGQAKKKDLAYTPFPIGMHTDNPYRDPTPDFQLLHAIQQCACPEGEGPPCASCTVMNHFVDGFYVLEQLAREDPEAFSLLATVPVRFENNGGDNSSALWFHVPHVQLHPEHLAAGAPPCLGAHCIRAIRFSAKSGGFAPPMEDEKLEKFYAARRKFSQLMHDPANTIQTQFRPGDMAIFDNQRILHARTAIAEGDGQRHVQGCYLNRDGVRLNHERLRRAAPTWSRIRSASKEDFETMAAEYQREVTDQLSARLLAMLEAQKGAYLGQPVDLYMHGIQTATRALRAGEDDDLVVAALLHDVTESLQPKAHGEAIAALLLPYLSPEAHFVLFHHETFQGYFYLHHFGGDRNGREALQGSEHYAAALRWNEYDEASFDPTYAHLPLAVFAKGPLARVFAREAFWWNASHPKKFVVTGGAPADCAALE